ncbi:MAG: OmpW family outer membrane protein [Pseudomonadota bacterium]|nr:OmpW family outer membrane protein [Pseudomonadota bacterium]
MKRSTLQLLFAAIGFVAGDAMAQQSAAETPWLVRVRAVRISPANESAPIGGIGAADRLHVSDKTIPELDVSYFFTPNLAAELVLTYPQKHDVTLDGANIGSFKHLPPTLSAQYHFMPEATVSPYLGAGVNYTTMSKVNLLNGAASLEHDSVGLSLQAGVDFRLDPHWSVNVDVKKVQIRSDVIIAGARASNVKVDPVLFGIGLGYRF